MKKFINTNLPSLFQTSRVFFAICNSLFIQSKKFLDYAQKLFRTKQLSQDFTDKDWEQISLEMLTEIAKERNIIRIHGETLGLFRERVQNAPIFLRECSTKDGIQKIIQTVVVSNNIPSYTDIDPTIPTTFEIKELFSQKWILDDPIYKLGHNSHITDSNQKYYFYLDIKQGDKNVILLPHEEEILRKTIDYYKPAHVRFHINCITLNNWILGDTSYDLGKNTYLPFNL